MPDDCMYTYTGRHFTPLAPRVEDFDVLDIARGLAFACRYRGQIKSYYSVAEHSVLVSRHCDPEYAREALMHDAAEAYIGDMIRPLKRLPEMRGFVEAEEKIEAVLAVAYGLRTDPAAHRAWKSTDDRILIDEIAALSPHPELYLDRSWLSGLQPLGAEILCYPPERAEVLFLARFGELFPEYVDADDLRIIWSCPGCGSKSERPPVQCACGYIP